MKPSAARHAFAVLMFAALPVAAQITVPRVSENIEVRVTSVDVVVTDATGKRVRGLTKDDFEVLDGKKPQPITNFSEFFLEPKREATAAAAPGPPGGAPAGPAAQPEAAAPPPRNIIFFFDVFSTARDDRRRLIPALTKLVGDFRPEDAAMVVSWNRTLRVVAGPTGDRATLVKGIERAASEASLRTEALTMTPDRLGDLPTALGPLAATSARYNLEMRNEARRRAHDAAMDLKDSVRGLKAIIQRVAGADGRKALILVSTAYSFAPPAAETSDSDQDLLLWLETLNAPPLLQELADAASAAGVAIYGIQAEGLQSGWSARTEGRKAAGDGFDMPVGAAFTTDLPALENSRTSGSALSGLTYLSTRTGGFAAGNSNSFTRAIASIGDDLGNYYSIGFSSPENSVDRKRNIEVRTRDRRYTVRARHSAVDRTQLEEMSDRVTGALLFPSSLQNQLGITATMASIERTSDRMKVPVDVKIPMGNLTFESGESELLIADLTIMIGSIGSDGGLSEVERFHQTIPITRAQVPQLAKSHYTYGIAVDLRSAGADNRLAIAVIDNVSKATGMTTVEIKAAR